MRWFCAAAIAALFIAGCQTAPPVVSGGGFDVTRQFRQPGEIAKARTAALDRLREENATRLRIHKLVEELLGRLGGATPGDTVLAELTLGEGRFDLPPGNLEAVLIVSSTGYPAPALVLAPIEAHDRGEYRPPGTIAPYLLRLDGGSVVSSCAELCARERVVLVPFYRR